MRTSYPPVGQLPGRDEAESYSGHQRDTITTAWVVLTGAFVIFLTLVAGAFLAARNYYETATLSQSATLALEQGIVLFRDPISSTLMNAHDQLELREGDELLVGQGSRASISLADGGKVLLYPGSQVKLTELSKSRFHDGFARTAIGVDKGTARVEVVSSNMKNNQYLVSTPFGYATLTPGSFGVDVTEGRTRISSRQGSATVYAKTGQTQLQSGEKVLLSKSELSGPLPEGDQLIANGDFSQGFAGWNKLDNHEPGRPVEPGQRVLANEKTGDRDITALRISRVSPAATHNETGLTQAVNRDVSDYQFLRLTALVRVDDQSLSGGGYMGYEYPIMIRVHYRDADGNQIDWSHGFFFKNTEQRPTPNGEEIVQSQWKSYSTDLMEAKPKPAQILSIEVLGAGHTFSGALADVGLVGK